MSINKHMSFVIRRRSSKKPTFACKLATHACGYPKLTVDADGTKHLVECTNDSTFTAPFCSEHSKSVYNLVVKKSNIKGAGFGLFAHAEEDESKNNRVPVFRKGDLIATYTGDVLTAAQFDQRYSKSKSSTAPYAIETGSGKRVIDSACNRGIASYANHTFDKKKVNSCLRDVFELHTANKSRPRIKIGDFWFKDYIPKPRGSNRVAATSVFSRKKYHYYPTSPVSLVARKNIYHGDEILTDYGDVYFTEGYLDKWDIETIGGPSVD